MRVLTYETDPNGSVQPTAKITIRNGGESYVCNPMDELRDAMEAGVPFVAHQVRALQPHDAVYNPTHVALIEPVSVSRLK